MSTSVPNPGDLAAEPLLAALAVLDFALLVVARTVRAAHPEVDRCPRPADSAALAAARQLVDDCDLALRTLDAYRDHVYARLRHPHRHVDWPF
jgi:hypothetical protein